MTASSIVAWLATYLIHSTILLGGALLVSRFVASHRARELMWKLAIAGGLVTSVVASLADFTPASRRWTVGPSAGSAEIAARITSIPAVPERPAQSPAPSVNERAAGPGAVATGGSSSEWTAAIVIGWALVSLLLIGRIVLHHRRLFGALSSRTPINDGPLPGILAELRRKAAIWTPVRLSSSFACPTPIALRSSEICIPARFVTDLDLEQQKTALAHELAHLKRRDPLWQMSIGIAESIFFFQPLNVFGRRRLRDAAEFLCDDWAVEQTNSPLALARCLTQIGSWVGSAPVPDGMLAMAEGGSPLVTRIHRLANWKPSGVASARIVSVVAMAAIAVVAWSAPVLSSPVSEPGMRNPVVMSTAVPASSTAPDSLIRYAGPAASLEQRWSWAVARQVNPPFWIGWEVEAPSAHARSLASSSAGVPHPGRSAQSLAEFAGGASSRDNAGILIRVDAAGAVSGVRLQSMTEPAYFGARPVIWLALAEPSESVARLKRLHAQSQATHIRSELAAALSVHAEPTVAVPALAEVIETERDSEVRVEAVQWLARLHGTDTRAIAILRRLALQDRQRPVQMEAVDGLRTSMNQGSREAQAALRSIADSDAHMSVRSEAMQALSRR